MELINKDQRFEMQRLWLTKGKNVNQIQDKDYEEKISDFLSQNSSIKELKLRFIKGALFRALLERKVELKGL
jgi:hypothetical protein